jgi:hypothetical protein
MSIETAILKKLADEHATAVGYQPGTPAHCSASGEYYLEGKAHMEAYEAAKASSMAPNEDEQIAALQEIIREQERRAELAQQPVEKPIGRLRPKGKYYSIHPTMPGMHIIGYTYQGDYPTFSEIVDDPRKITPEDLTLHQELFDMGAKHEREAQQPLGCASEKELIAHIAQRFSCLDNTVFRNTPANCNIFAIYAVEGMKNLRVPMREASDLQEIYELARQQAYLDNNKPQQSYWEGALRALQDMGRIKS